MAKNNAHYLQAQRERRIEFVAAYGYVSQSDTDKKCAVCKYCVKKTSSNRCKVAKVNVAEGGYCTLFDRKPAKEKPTVSQIMAECKEQHGGAWRAVYLKRLKNEEVRA